MAQIWIGADSVNTSAASVVPSRSGTRTLKNGGDAATLDTATPLLFVDTQDTTDSGRRMFMPRPRHLGHSAYRLNGIALAELRAS
jgi:hypothetical protein